MLGKLAVLSATTTITVLTTAGPAFADAEPIAASPAWAARDDQLIRAATKASMHIKKAPAAPKGWARAKDAPVVAAVPVARFPSRAVVLHYAADPQGNTALAGVSDPFSRSIVSEAAATTTVPFKYKADWAALLRGRDMQTTTTVFCNDYHSTYVELPVEDTYTYIQLVRSETGYDTYYTTVKYPNDGATRGYCWAGHSNSRTYYFNYKQSSTNGRVTAGGYVHG